jgi:hypothetical protein
MKPKQLLIIGFIFLSSCSFPKYNFVSLEFIAYNYIWTYNPDVFGLRCYRYTVICKDGNVLFYSWKKDLTYETFYFTSEVEEVLIDSILVASERQKEYLKNDEYATRYDDGPNLKIKINYCDGTYEVIDFVIETVLYKYFECILPENKFEPTNDTIDFIKQKLELINIAWKEDSTYYKFEMPLQIDYSKYQPDPN